MKKNFLTVAAMAVVAFFVSTEIAKATDVSFSGQIRTRWDATEQFGGNTAASPAGNNQTDDAVFSSVRLAAHANVNESTSAFIQFQSTRNWGENGGGAAAQGAGDGNASFTANDNDNSVGIHQAYMTFNNFLSIPGNWDAKIGRQEILLDGWRLFGNTIWTPGMQSHDAATFLHKHDNMTLLLGYILAQENGRVADPADHDDRDAWLAHLNVKGVLGGQFSGYYVWLDQQSEQNGQAISFHTIGGRQAGKLMGLDYRGEFYYQWGDAAGVNNGTVTGNRGTNNDDVDFDAYMFGVRVGKTFNNVSFKPGLTVWYDYLSGTSDKDGRDGDWSSFNTLFDTGHKYYGLIDLFLGVGNGTGSGTRGLGLQDFALKGKINPVAGWTVKADYHWFWTAEGVMANSTATGLGAPGAGRTLGNSLGNELDITAITKLNANTKVMIGYSNYSSTDSFRQIKNTTASESVNGDNMQWGYVQIDLQF